MEKKCAEVEVEPYSTKASAQHNFPKIFRCVILVIALCATAILFTLPIGFYYVTVSQ